MKKSLCAFMLLIACLSMRYVNAQQSPGRTIAAVSLTAGELKIVKIGDEESSPNRVFFVNLNGRTIATINDAMYVNIYAYFSGLESGEVVVLNKGSGGSGCPEMFQVVYPQSSESAYVSEEFGDCSDIPKVTLEHQQITFRFPGFYRLAQVNEPGFHLPAPSTWIFRGGRLSKVRATPRRSRR
jgi:hypothetical protein